MGEVNTDNTQQESQALGVTEVPAEKQILQEQPTCNSDCQQVPSGEESQPGPSSPPVAKGNYNIDFDSIDLENFNPFGTKSNVTQDTHLSLPLSSKVAQSESPTKLVDKEPVQKVPVTGESVKEEVPEFVTQEVTPVVPEVPESVKGVPQSLQQETVGDKKEPISQREESAKVTEPVCEPLSGEGPNIDLVSVEEAPPSTQAQAELSSQALPLSTNQENPSSPPLVPKGSYTIDFDSIDLESFNPFGTQNKVVNDLDSLPLSSQPVENASVPPVIQDIKASPTKPSPQKVSPKKSPKKPAVDKASPKKDEEEADDSFHDAVEDIPSLTRSTSQLSNTQPQVSRNQNFLNWQ